MTKHFAIAVAALALSAASAICQPLAAGLSSELQLGFHTSSSGIRPDSLNVESRNCYDYSFTGAPTDWVPRGGLWSQTNRWTCQPQWSFYGGYSDGVAALWNKRIFGGDLCVEAWMAFKMGLGTFSGYKNPNDMNIVLLGDGANLDSGYQFQVGANLNMATRILRNGKVLAETRDEKCLLPIFENGAFSTYTFHRRWWSIKAERVGNRLSLYMDNKLILSAEDPEPLKQGRVALWTLNNGILVSRVRINYSDEAPHQPAGVVPDLLVAGDEMDGSMPLKVESKTHPGLFLDFEHGLGTLTNPSGDQGPALLQVDGGVGGGQAVKIVNVNAGGDFETKILPAPMTVGADGVRRIDFDYKLSPDVKVNLFAKVEHGLYEIVFTGLDTPSPMAQILGKIEGVKADGKWHHASFDLWGHLRRVFGDEKKALSLDDLFFAQRSFDRYLMAGFGGNHAGAAYYLDNFSLWRPGGAVAAFSWEPLGRQVTYSSRSRRSMYYRRTRLLTSRAREPKPEYAAYAVVLDNHPDTIPPATQTIKETEWNTPGLKPGVHYFHIRPQLPDGTWAPTVHQMVVTDGDPPHVADVSPKSGATCGDQDVVITLTDEGGIGVNPASIVLAVNGEEYSLASPGLRYDLVTEKLTFDPRAAKVSFDDKQRVQLQLIAAEDYLGHPVAPMQWAFVMDYKSDKRAPDPPIVSAAGDYLCDDTFEHDMGEWANYGSANGAIVSRDASTKASGAYSLKLYNRTNGGLFGAYVRKTSFDAGKYRIVSFDYKVNDRLREDFAIYVNGDWKDIVFTDNDNNLGTVGEVPNVQRDDKWRHAEFNLYDMLRRDDPRASGYLLRHFVAGDWGTTGNTQRATWWVDNFRIMPVVSGLDGLRFTWESADMTGVAGASWVLDDNPDTVPPEKINAREPEVVAPVDASGMKYLHVRTRDGAGNWGETTHYRVLVDAVAPSAGTVLPAPNSVGADPKVVIPLSDEGGAGIDPGSLTLVVDSADKPEDKRKQYTVKNAGMTYDSDRHVLTWDPQKTSPRPTVFPDGQTVAVALKSAADYAGNPVTTLPAWTWTMDYSKDVQPPVVATLKARTHLTAICDTFEEDLGEWAGRGGQRGAKVERDSSTAASGQYSVKLTNPIQNGAFQAVVSNTEFDVTQTPYMSFDYRVPPGVHADFQLRMADSWYAVQFTDNAPSAHGRVPGVKADGQWHHTTVNLAGILRPRQRRRTKRLLVSQIIIGDRGSRNNAAGASLNIDNFMVAALGKTSPAFSWKATDPTGVVEYAYVLDQDPATVPQPQGQGLTAQKTFTGVRDGLWFFHVRAKDGAGHWGPTLHYGFLNRKLPPTR